MAKSSLIAEYKKEFIKNTLKKGITLIRNQKFYFYVKGKGIVSNGIYSVLP